MSNEMRSIGSFYVSIGSMNFMGYMISIGSIGTICSRDSIDS